MSERVGRWASVCVGVFVCGCVGEPISGWVRVKVRVRVRVTVRVSEADSTCACRACAGLCSNGDKGTSPV